MPAILIAVITALLAFNGCDRYRHVEVHLIPRNQVYLIVQHYDSLYFSTLKSGLFRMHPDDTSSMMRVAAYRNAPLRSFVFTSADEIMAGSYEQGAFMVKDDSMTPVPGLPRVIWRIRRDTVTGHCWFATGSGVYVSAKEGYRQFARLPESHDIAICKNRVAVAHLKGITIFNKETGAVLDEAITGKPCWVIETFDSLFVGGGRDFCYSINPVTGEKTTISLKSNYLWSVSRDAGGNLFFGTQKGVFLVPRGSHQLRNIALKGMCVKSVIIDDKQRLWVALF